MLPKSFSPDDNVFRATWSGHDAWAQEEGCTHEPI
jgi:hypothetical protein